MLKVPFNDTSRIYKLFSNELDSALIDTAKSGWWLLGAKTDDFSREFSAYLNISYCLPVANGTDALELSIKALQNDVDVKDAEVITVANAGGYSTIACHLAGVNPIYVDINDKTLLVDIDLIKNKLSKRTLAVVATHLFGAVVDVPAIRRALDSEGYSHVKIIEDCAQAHGAQLNGKKVGTLGDIAAFSFYPTKNLGALGDAGAVVTNSPDLFRTAKSLQQYGWNQKYKVALKKGKNTRMDELQAAVLSVILPHLDHFNQKRKNIYEKYKSLGLKTVIFNDYNGTDFVAHLAVVRVKKRDEFQLFLSEKGIATDIHYPVIDNFQEAWFDKTINGELTKSELASKNIISIPCFPNMTDVEVEYVCDILKKWDEING